MQKLISLLCIISTIGMLLSLAGCGHTHTYEETVLQEATCQQDGSIEHRCTECGESYTETINGEHNYTEKILKASTCETAGSARYTCTYCNDSYVDTLSLASHKYENKYCVNCGTKKVGKIRTPFTPLSLDYGSNDYVRSTCRITDISCEVSYYGQMTIYFDGVMTYYDSGDTISGPCSFMLIVYDARGNIIYSDQIMTHCIVNQTFKIYTTVDAYIDSTEDYRIELKDYMS